MAEDFHKVLVIESYVETGNPFSKNSFTDIKCQREEEEEEWEETMAQNI